MLDPSTYPVAPATIMPTTKPTMILAFFRNGLPNTSTMMMVMKDRKPRPMNSAEPQSSGLGAFIVGQRAKRLKQVDLSTARARNATCTHPVAGRDRHALEPPAQLTKPDLPIREAPIRRTTRPVMCGGKTRLRILGGTKARPIWKLHQHTLLELTCLIAYHQK